MLRRLATSGVLVLLTILAVPASNGQAAPPRTPRTPPIPAPTSVVHVRPVSAKGHLLAGYTVTHQHKHAQCSFGSEATGNAYRCFAGNFVFDPCWVESVRAFVVCLPDPWGYKVTQLHVTKGYSNGGFSKKHAKLPWGVQISNGVQCGFLEGATGVVKGKRINYGCVHAKYVLIGNVNKSGSTWTIRKATPSGGGHYSPAGRVKLTKAWFGKASRKG